MEYNSPVMKIRSPKSSWFPQNTKPGTGVAMSLGIAALVSIPLLVRMDRIGLQAVLGSLVLVATYTFTCWMIQAVVAFPSSGTPTGPWRLVASLSLGVVCAVLFNHPSLRRELGVIRPLGSPGPIAEWILLGFRSLVLNGVVFLARYYMELSVRAQRQRLENEQLRREGLQARLLSLQDRLSPHFLFNALATLRGVARNEEAKEFVSRLAEVYRHLLGREERPVSTLRDELAFLDAYLYVQSTRFETGLRIERAIDASLLDRSLPSLSLQILAENAIKHNVVSSVRPLVLSIRAAGGEVVLENNLQPKRSVEDGTGSGLGGLAERQRLLGGGDVLVEKEDGVFRVRIPLFP